MSDATQSQDVRSVREDIAFMRALAEQGAQGPVFGGSMLIAAGVIYATACLANWWVLVQRPAEASAWMGPIWAGAITAHAVALTVAILWVKARGYVWASPNRSNRVFRRAWNAVGWAILSCLASFFLTSWLGHVPQVFVGYPVVIFLLYGVGWMVTAAATNERWTVGVGFLSFAFAVAAGALAYNPNLLLFYAAALLLLLAAPGAVLLYKARVRS